MNIKTTILKLMGIAYRLPHVPKGADVFKIFTMDLLETLELGDRAQQENNELLISLIDIAKDIIQEPKELGLLQSEIGVICRSDVDFGEDIITNITCADLTNVDNLTSQINSEVNSIKRAMKHDVVADLVKKASHALQYKSNTIKDVDGFLNTLVTDISEKIEPPTGKHIAEVDTFDADDKGKLTELFEEGQSVMDGRAVLKTGWKHLNTMLQGGFRMGETTMIPALPHSYKTSGTLSIFRQICQYNEPTNTEGKKEVLVRISFEDSLPNNLIFLYKNIIYNKTLEPVDIRGVSPEEMADVVNETLTKSGFKVIFSRYSGSNFSHSDIVNVANKLESDGYLVKLMMVDYLLKCNLEGISKEGPSGIPQRTLFERTRDAFAAKNIAFITPAQLGPAARRVSSSGIMQHQFLGRIAGQGMTAESSQIDQVVDACFYLHKCMVGEKTFLHFLLDKHRLPLVIGPAQKQFFLPFPLNGESIPDDVHLKRPISTRNLETLEEEGEEDFDF